MAFQRAFERDIQALRRSGYPIVSEPDAGSGHAHVYRIDATAPIIAPLSALDVGLVRSVLSVLGKKDTGVTGAAHTGMAKLLAASDSRSQAPRFVRASVPSGDAAPLARAIHYRQRVRFAYQGSGAQPSTYLLEPTSLSEHFQVFYVAGLARREGSQAPWQQRTFRVSRIVDGSLKFEGPAVGDGGSGGLASGDARASGDSSVGDAAFSGGAAPSAVAFSGAASVGGAAPSATSASNSAVFSGGTALSDSAASSAVPASGEISSDDVFTARRAILAIRPGCAQPLASRGRPCQAPAGAEAPEGWQTVELSPVGRQRLFEDLALYGRDVALLGEADLLAEWRGRLCHLARLASREAADGR